MNIKSYIVTVDADRLEEADFDAEYPQIERALRLGVMGRDYPKGRGIKSIEPMTVLRRYQLE